MNAERGKRNAARFHSVTWSDDARTLIALFDLADGGVGAQTWTIGQAVTELRRVDSAPAPFVPRDLPRTSD